MNSVSLTEYIHAASFDMKGGGGWERGGGGSEVKSVRSAELNDSATVCRNFSPQ